MEDGIENSLEVQDCIMRRQERYVGGEHLRTITIYDLVTIVIMFGKVSCLFRLLLNYPLCMECQRLSSTFRSGFERGLARLLDENASIASPSTQVSRILQ